jgi:hypothetical protein
LEIKNNSHKNIQIRKYLLFAVIHSMLARIQSK